MKKKLSRLAAILLVLAMCFGVLAACGSSSSSGDTDEDTTAAVAEETTEAEEATLDRAELAIPNEYTKVKIFSGSYGFGDAEITYAMNDDESAYYITFVCFDEDQILEGTIADSIVTNTYDLSGFCSSDAQQIYEDCMGSSEEWVALSGEGIESPSASAGVSRDEYGIPEDYTKVKIFSGSYGFGDAEITYAMNDDESAYYVTFVCFDEDQILEGTVADSIVTNTYDLSGFCSSDAQQLYEDCMTSTEEWQTLQ